MASGKIQQEVAITTTGVKELKEAEKLVDSIDGSKTTATVEVAVEGARDLDKFVSSLDGLSTERKTIVLGLEAANVQLQLEDITLELRKLAGTGVDIKAKIENANQLENELNTLKAKITSINDTPLQPGRGAGVEEFTGSVRSANQSASLLGNTIGNTAQDVSQLAGVGSTAGIAISQLAQDMTAAAASGEGLAAVMATLAEVAAPLALLAGGLAVLEGSISDVNKENAQSKQNVSDYASSISSAGDATVGLAEGLQKSVQGMTDFRRHATGDIALVGEFIDREILEKIPLIGSGLSNAFDFIPGFSDKAKASNIPELLDRTGTSQGELAKTTEGNILVNEALIQTWKDQAAQGIITKNELDDLTSFLKQYQVEAHEAQKSTQKLTLDSVTYADTLQDIINKNDPLSQHVDLWKQLEAAITSGDTAAGTTLVNTLASIFKTTPAEILGIALDDLDKKKKADAKASEEQAKAQEKANEEMRKTSIATDDARDALVRLGGAFSQMAINEGAIKSAFDLGNAPLDALEATKKYEDSLRDLKTFVQKDLKGKTPDIFHPDINAGPFLAKIRVIREQLQAKVADAFATGGAPAAAAMANGLIDQFVETFHGRFTKANAQNLLLPGGLNFDITIGVDQSSKAEAEKELEILTGVGGKTPWTASIELALDAGQLTPAQARLLIEQRLRDLNVAVPASVAVKNPTTADLQAADTFLKANPVDMITHTTPPTNAQMDTTRQTAQNFFNSPANWITVPVTTTFKQTKPWWVGDAGGTAPASGGIAGERGPEILNERYLITEPTYVPPGTRVTSRRQTARILRTSRAASLRRFDSGGTVTPIVQPINVNINAAVVGNRFDVMRAVQRANLDRIRLLGTRG